MIYYSSIKPNHAAVLLLAVYTSAYKSNLRLALAYKHKLRSMSMTMFIIQVYNITSTKIIVIIIISTYAHVISGDDL